MASNRVEKRPSGNPMRKQEQDSGAVLNEDGKRKWNAHNATLMNAELSPF